MIGRPLTPMSVAGVRRRGRRRGLIVGAAVGASMARNNNQAAEPEETYAAPAPTQDDSMQQLQQLAQLKEQGILTEEEFAAKKAQLLGL